MVLTAASFFACAVPVSFAWYFIWRFLSGLSGAVLIVVAAPSILPSVSADRRGRASGLIFTGVGLGAAASGTLIPWMLDTGLAATWVVLGIMATLVTVAAWPFWPAHGRSGPAPSGRAPGGSWPLRRTYLQYGLNAAGLVPHMIFLVDFVARGLAYGVGQGATVWVVFGVGAACGPYTLGRLADRYGFRRVLLIGYGLQMVAIGLPVLTGAILPIFASAFIAGAYTPGIVPLVLGRIRELVPDPARQPAVWGTATASFAVMQATGAYGFTYLYAATGSYGLLFALGATAVAAALCLEFVGPGRDARPIKATALGG